MEVSAPWRAPLAEGYKQLDLLLRTCELKTYNEMFSFQFRAIVIKYLYLVLKSSYAVGL